MYRSQHKRSNGRVRHNDGVIPYADNAFLVPVRKWHLTDPTSVAMAWVSVCTNGAPMCSPGGPSVWWHTVPRGDLVLYSLNWCHCAFQWDLQLPRLFPTSDGGHIEYFRLMEIDQRIPEASCGPILLHFLSLNVGVLDIDLIDIASICAAPTRLTTSSDSSLLKPWPYS